MEELLLTEEAYVKDLRLIVEVNVYRVLLVAAGLKALSLPKCGT